MNWTPRFAERLSGMRPSEVRELLKLLERPEIISFAGGVPDPALFPIAELKNGYQDILSDPILAARSMQYGASEGWTPLREHIAAQMTAKGVRCDVENIMITHGAQQAIEFSAKLFVDPGSEILLQSPTFLGALQSFNLYRPIYRYLPEPGEKSDLIFSSPPRMAYVMADFQNPTGRTLNLVERAETIRLARDLGTPVIEDNPYGEIYFENEPLPSLAALDLDGRPIDDGLVIYCGTVSKVLAPGLRVGWVAGPRPIIDKMVLLKQATDIQVSTINQVIAVRLMESLPEDRMDHVRAVYRRRRDAMLAALARFMPDGVTWTKPEGGLFIWVELPAHADSAALLVKAVEQGVAFVPGVAFYPDRSVKNTLRLSYSLAEPALIETGIERLGALFRAAF